VRIWTQFYARGLDANETADRAFEDRIGGYKKGIDRFPLQQSKSRREIQLPVDP